MKSDLLSSRKLFTSLCFILLSFVYTSSIAQARRVTGRVTGNEDRPLSNVSVTVKGTNIGTTTDATGTFSINAAASDSLVFGHVGYTDQTVSAAGEGNLVVSMVGAAAQMNEVVVIGYQTVRRRDLTGSASIVSAQQANRVTSNSIGESIQGLAPGVTVRTGGGPGQNAAIEIRGVASFLNTSPLYVIDGMIADANTTINNNDVESIQVLKDASAAAIYGSRAANGVIIITTKQGREGPVKVSASAKYGISQIPKRWDVMNNVEFAATQRQQYINSGAVPLASVGSQFDPTINTDWQEAMIRTGNLSDYNVSMSGGGRNNNFLVSVSHLNNKGVLIGHDFSRSTLRLNSRATKGRVTFGENMVLSQSVYHTPSEGNPFYDMPQMLPVIPVQSDKLIDRSQAVDNPLGFGVGTNNAITYAINPVAVNTLARRNSAFSKLVGNAYVDVKLANWLNYKFNAGAEVSFDNVETIRKQGRWAYVQSFVLANVNQNRSRFSSLLFEHTLNFNKTFGKHSINGVVGFSDQQVQRDGATSGRNGLQQYSGEYLTTISSATGSNIAFGDISRYRIRGYLGRVNYNFNDRYLLTFSGRLDQDSRFSEQYRNGFFPSVAASWRISKEDFFNVPWVSDLKLRASYGKLGVVSSGPWEYLGLLNINPRVVFGPQQGIFVGSTQARLANPDLHWEERISRNIGFDASLFNNRVSLTAEFYNSRANDVLVNLPVALYLGNLLGDPIVNAASIENQGFEVSLTYRDNRRPFKYDVSANATTIRNRVKDVGNRGAGVDYIQTGLTRSQVGYSVGQWFLVEDLGLFQSQAEIDAYVGKTGSKIQPFAKPGDVKFRDANGDGQITESDRVYYGSPWPTLQTGAQFNASYKGFTFNLQLVGVFGYKIYNDVRRILMSYQHTNFLKEVNPWTPTNTNTNDFRLARGDNDISMSDNVRGNSTRWLSDAGYMRIRNVEFGYNFKGGFFERANISNARVFVSGQNLLTITKYTGLDPDVTGNGILERGVDNGNWPASRVISIGLNCEF